jgi:SPP1 gp7 family putative phage head morphogenesis protein
MARKLLTRKRATWVRSREHDGVMKGKPLAYPAGVMERYHDKLVALTAHMCEVTEKAFVELFHHPDVEDYFTNYGQTATVAMDISPASQARILANKLKAHFDQLFNERAKPMAEAMANQANAASASATYQSLKQLSGGLSLNVKSLSPEAQEILKLAIANNVALIKSIPEQYFQKAQGAIFRSITDGKGLSDVHDFFSQQYGEQTRRAKNVALDQTRKTYNALNKGRAQKAGVRKFEWLHSGGGLHPRPLHQAYNGRIFSYDDLPVIDEATGEKGIPGQAPNCGCTMRPVIEFDKGEAA